MVLEKLTVIGQRIAYMVLSLPKRLLRLVYHILSPFGLFPASYQAKIIRNPLDWIVGLFFYLIDILGIPEWYEILFELLKWKTKYLSKAEIGMSRVIFGDSVKLDMIRLDERAHLGPKQYNFAYVSFHTINSFGAMSRPILIHELMHVWQYHHIGSIYSYMALKAQKSVAGYNYGGIRTLQTKMEEGASILDFNFEQQAEIVMDAFRYQQRIGPSHPADPRIVKIFEYFLNQVFIEKKTAIT